ncbi:unnamed protein product [Cylindrotheca closterium]|uniref:Uncharacterized protein n=1 Tax=Cylindrotheca closterium TaxID=2856 RepID=A0AAD2FNV3_9STRA|nr:unnamed protein product [Cylindrotheca closterium]
MKKFISQKRPGEAPEGGGRRKKTRVLESQFDQVWVDPSADVSTPKPCQGIRITKDTAQKYRANMAYFFSKRIRDKARDTAKVVEEKFSEESLNSFFTNKENIRFTKDQSTAFNEFIDSYAPADTSQYELDTVGEGVFVFWSKECTRFIDMSSSTSRRKRCKACVTVDSLIYHDIERSRPLGIDGAVPKDTQYAVIQQHPTTVVKALEQRRDKVRTVKLEILKLARKSQESELHKHAGCSTHELEEGVLKAFKVANKNIDVYLGKSKEIKDDQVGKAQVKNLWEVHMEHLQKLKERGGKMRGVRFHPELLNYAILILAKTSQSVYTEL